MNIIYFIFSMIAPVTILSMGIFWKLAPPHFQAKGLAYKTALTCSSEEAWNFAHKHCAKLWLRIGVILCVLTVVIMTVFQDYYMSFLLWLIVGQMVLFCASAFFIDILLKSSFDEQGKKIL